MNSKTVKHVQVFVKFLGKGKRKWATKAIQASADCIEEACYLVVPRFVEATKLWREWEILSCDCVDATETDYGCSFGPMVSVPLFRECSAGYVELYWDEVIKLGISSPVSV